MSERKDERWLDDQLQRAINGATPVFDAKAWRQRYSREFQTLLGRSGQRSRFGACHIVRLVLRNSLGRTALAAVVLVTVGVLLVGRFGAAPGHPVPGQPPVAQESPSQMVSMISLAAAFRRGGINELDRQFERALDSLGPRPNSVSVQELLRDINDKG